MPLTAGAAVATLPDTVGGLHMTVAPNFPAPVFRTDGPNGQPYLDFAGGAVLLQSDASKVGPDVTVIAVVQKPTPTGGANTTTAVAPNAQAAIISASGFDILAGFTDLTHTPANQPWVNNTVNGSGVALERMWINGAEVGLGSQDIGSNWSIISVTIRGLPTTMTAMRLNRASNGSGTTTDLRIGMVELYNRVLTRQELNVRHQQLGARYAIPVTDSTVKPTSKAQMHAPIAFMNRKRALDGSDVDSYRDWAARAVRQLKYTKTANAAGVQGYYDDPYQLSINKGSFSIPVYVVPPNQPTARVGVSGWSNQTALFGSTDVSGLATRFQKVPLPTQSALLPGTNNTLTMPARVIGTVQVKAAAAIGDTTFVSNGGFPSGWTIGAGGLPWVLGTNGFRVLSVAKQATTNDYLWTIDTALTAAVAAGASGTCQGEDPVVPVAGATSIVLSGGLPYLFPAVVTFETAATGTGAPPPERLQVTTITARLDSTRVWNLSTPLASSYALGQKVRPQHQIEADGNDKHVGILQPYCSISYSVHKGTVATLSALPSSGQATGDGWVTGDTGHLWAWSGTAWVDGGISRWAFWEMWGVRYSTTNPDGLYCMAYGGYCDDFYHWNGVYKYTWGSRACGNSMLTGLVTVAEWQAAADAATAANDVTKYRDAIPHQIGVGYVVTGSDYGVGISPGTRQTNIAPANRWDGTNYSGVAAGAADAISKDRMVMGARWALSHLVTDAQIITWANAGAAVEVKYRVAVGFAMRDFGCTTIDTTTGAAAIYVEDERASKAGYGFGATSSAIPEEYRIRDAVLSAIRTFDAESLLPVMA